jgi:uncharacterized protein (TIGR02147 family)
MNYRDMLALKFTHLKATQKFSYRRVSWDAGWSSPNFFKLVLKGDRNLTPTSAIALAQALQLTDEETNILYDAVVNDLIARS